MRLKDCDSNFEVKYFSNLLQMKHLPYIKQYVTWIALKIYNNNDWENSENSLNSQLVATARLI